LRVDGGETELESQAVAAHPMQPQLSSTAGIALRVKGLLARVAHFFNYQRTPINFQLGF